MNVVRSRVVLPVQRISSSQQPLIYMQNRFNRFYPTFYKNRSKNIFMKHYRNNNVSHRQFAILGASVMSAYFKTSLIFWGIPITAALSSIMPTLPFDAIYGCILPYHSYMGMSRIFADYLPAYIYVSYIIAAVMFVGLQNLNFNGEGISPLVRRFIVGKTLPLPPKEQNK